MRWKVQPYAACEIWHGMTCVGTLSGAALCLIVEHYLATAALQAAVTADLDRPLPAWTPGLTGAVIPVAPRKPPTAVDKAANRARRRARGR
jgi:hypothetical protein